MPHGRSLGLMDLMVQFANGVRAYHYRCTGIQLHLLTTEIHRIHLEPWPSPSMVVSGFHTDFSLFPGLGLRMTMRQRMNSITRSERECKSLRHDVGLLTRLIVT
jgi:hypothetical protein